MRGGGGGCGGEVAFAPLVDELSNMGSCFCKTSMHFFKSNHLRGFLDWIRTCGYMRNLRLPQSCYHRTGSMSGKHRKTWHFVVFHWIVYSLAIFHHLCL